MSLPYFEVEPPCPTCGGHTETGCYDAEIGCVCVVLYCIRCGRPTESLLPGLWCCEHCAPEVPIRLRVQGRDRRGRFTRKEPVL